jgi:nicotinate-nucleotide adenylyltransferase
MVRPSTPARIGLFGGTFDPVHNGHLLIAHSALEEAELDLLLFIPCRISPHKTGRKTTPAADRLAMLRKAVRGESSFAVSDWEISRPGPSYSYLTAGHFSTLYPRARLFWIIGNDHWKVLPTWARWKELARLVTFVVFPRPDPPKPRSGTRLLPLSVRIDISATMIRTRIRAQKSVGHLLAAPVERYIRSRRLYLR